jgi:hypothetical protein
MWKSTWGKVVIVLLFVLIVSVIWTRSKVRVEALQNNTNIRPADALAEIGKKKDAAKGMLNLADNHDNLQDLILDYDQWAGFSLLNLMCDPDNMEKNLQKFNNLCEFRTNLNSVLGFLDKT